MLFSDRYLDAQYGFLSKSGRIKQKKHHMRDKLQFNVDAQTAMFKWAVYSLNSVVNASQLKYNLLVFAYIIIILTISPLRVLIYSHFKLDLYCIFYEHTFLMSILSLLFVFNLN